MTILGTRPDAVKLAPIVRALNADPTIDSGVTVTAQHRDMLDQVLTIFGIQPKHDLDLMQHGQVLSDFAARAIASLGALFAKESPEIVIVQGDTTTAMAGALAAHYCGSAVAHVEAGLRSHDLRNPFPEEANRRIISQLANLHFAPTETSRQNLLAEGVPPDRIRVTGNSVIDALLYAADRAGPERLPPILQAGVRSGRRLVLVTLHRRESFGLPLEGICDALGTLVDRYPDVELFVPVHPNPNVRRTVHDRLGGRDRVYLAEPLGYIEFVAVMRAAYLIVTDSGGVQEEAPSLGKPVLVVRDATERPEVVAVGAARLVGRNPANVLAAASELLTNPNAYEAMTGHENPYGDGHAAERIAEVVREYLSRESQG
jgi:UDP-N-acetylglucosamine 2-epimerase (non-hydrolysing)